MPPRSAARQLASFARATLGLLAFPLACVGLRADILENGDMSAGKATPAGWDQRWVGAGKLVTLRDEAVFHSAPASLRLSARDGSAKGQVYQSAPTLPGERLAASGWIKCEGADTTAQIALQFFNESGAPISFSQIRYVAGDTNWSQGKIVAVAPAQAARVAFVLLLDGDGQAWLDDAVLARAPEGAAVTSPPPAATGAPADTPASPASLAGEGTLIAAIADFRKQTFNYGYEGWKNLAAVTQRGPEGLLLTGPAAGGAGVVYVSPAPIDGATHLRLRYRMNEGNSAYQLHFKLLGSPEAGLKGDLKRSADGAVQSLLAPLPAKRPARVTQVQFQGSFSPTETFNITLLDAAFVRID